MQGQDSWHFYCPKIGCLAFSQLPGAANLKTTSRLHANEAELWQNCSAWSSQCFNLGQVCALVDYAILFFNYCFFFLAVKNISILRAFAAKFSPMYCLITGPPSFSLCIHCETAVSQRGVHLNGCYVVYFAASLAPGSFPADNWRVEFVICLWWAVSCLCRGQSM